MHGFVHRDVKAENLLIDHKFRLVIADFNFSRKLQEENAPQHKEKSQQTFSAHQAGNHSKQYSARVVRDFPVGSESYNAPELWKIHEIS
jgi:serine/threonine protein kinase